MYKIISKMALDHNILTTPSFLHITLLVSMYSCIQICMLISWLQCVGQSLGDHEPNQPMFKFKYNHKFIVPHLEFYLHGIKMWLIIFQFLYFINFVEAVYIIDDGWQQSGECLSFSHISQLALNHVLLWNLQSCT